MADVGQRAAAEAERKGLHGEAEQRYVGGVFNRIRQAHSAATTPKGGRRNLLRRKRVEDRQEAQNRRDRLTERANGEAFRLRARTRREEGRKPATPPQRPAAPAATPAKPETAPLVPVKSMGGRFRDPSAPVDPYFLQELYGDAQLEAALSRYTEPRLREAVQAVQARHPGTHPRGKGKAAMIAYVKTHINGAPATPPQRPAAPAATARPAEKGQAQNELDAIYREASAMPRPEDARAFLNRNEDRIAALRRAGAVFKGAAAYRAE